MYNSKYNVRLYGYHHSFMSIIRGISLILWILTIICFEIISSSLLDIGVLGWAGLYFVLILNV